MATTKPPKPTLPTSTAATTPAEDPETTAATTPSPETPPAPEPPAANIGGTVKDNTKQQKAAAKAGQLIAADEIRPAITDHRVQLVSHIYPDGTCDALTTMPPRVVIASRVMASMMHQPRIVQGIVGREDQRAKVISDLVGKALAIADELLRQAAESYFDTIPGDPEPIAAETDNPEA